MVELLGCAAVPEEDEPVDGAALEEELLVLPLLELPEDPCAHAAPAIRQPATRAVEMVR
jgi:hypothetical protein